MRISIVAAAGLFAFPAIAISATDIPTRYSGSFPSVGNVTSVTGTFTGKTLALKYTVVRAGRFSSVTGNYDCATKSAMTTRCEGRWAVEKTGQKGRGSVDVTWKGGTPIKTKIKAFKP